MSAPHSPRSSEYQPLTDQECEGQDETEERHSPPQLHVRRHHSLGMLYDASYDAWQAVNATMRYSYSNVLLFCVPLGIIAAEHHWHPATIFTINFLAMFPLASILTFSTEQLAAKVGSIMSGLINATFGNAVEMIVGINALKEAEIGIVQSSMIGSILSSILLILGSCFFFSGLGKKTVDINVDVVGILTSLMIISSASLIIPTTLQATEPPSGSEGPQRYILALSRITSIILLVFYIMYLFFQTWSHSHLFDEEDEEEGETNKLGIIASSTVLILATLGVAVCSDYLVDSIDGFVDAIGIGRAFIGMIIVPIVGNAGEFVSTVKWARTGRINLAIGVIVGATLQISLFVTPFLVMVGWVIGRPMSLQFDTFETVVLAMSALVVNGLVRGGKTNYFEGLLLIGTYLIVAIAFWVQPQNF